ncbi:radical SAM family heme chaperone HemW [Alcanivorax quisquiliarum]|uniref:Heme chaperone HemW n=1 Tax=Alcanivorax quisquiliarum TaxID=2933565 RepID=A0ABT0E4R4_9GAMM|nr:radical SAM family heme chaperone HemW [Alcanivorax quisquiliarum]MCK0536809.1 radical SAM family heme chaperone HemW [Alcanivorax quisquiliarum]
MTLALPPLALYVHLPWCVRKCPYCDFNSHEREGALPEQEYLAALKQDIADEQAAAGNRPINSIFFGGGTPSLLSPGFYEALLSYLAGALSFADDIEITLEANPGTVEQQRFEGFHAAGINRLSLGVQSFNERHLRALGRIHSGTEAARAVQQAQAAGFENINLDLMHALPDQTPEESEADLRQAVALAPTHISWYELTIEPNTAFFRAPPQQPDGDTLADAETTGFALLADAGYQRYEVSAFAQAGRLARHNLNYWQFGDYLGIGAGAHGKITNPAQGEILRYRKTRLPAHYLAEGGQRRRDAHTIPADQLPFEFLLNALRLLDGVPQALFPARTGLPLSHLQPALAQLRQRGLLHPDRLACTPTGLRFLNNVLAAFQG